MGVKFESHMDEFVKRVKDDPFADIKTLPCPTCKALVEKNTDGNFVCGSCGTVQVPKKKKTK